MIRLSPALRLVAGLIVFAFGAGCAASSPTATPQTGAGTSGQPTTGVQPGATAPAGPLPRPDHVVVAIFENTSYAQIVADPRARYFHQLMADSAVFTNAHGVAHPSQPNYLALFSGSTHGVRDDHCPVRLGDQPNLGRQLLDRGLTFTGYSEDLPAPGYTGCGYSGYAAKHNPWVDFGNLPATVNQPYAAFPGNYTKLPTVAFVVPNLCHDMHNCPISSGDRWARQNLDGYLRWAHQHNSLLVITFDEDEGGGANHILTLVAGAGVRPGHYPRRVTHYSTLATIEAMYGLTPLGEAASATVITQIWR